MGLAGADKDYTDEFNSDDTAAKKIANDDDFEFDTPLAAQASKPEPFTRENKPSEPVVTAAAPEPAPAAPEPVKQSFKEAFAANRKAGNGTFEWNGKKYTTAMATDKAKGSPAPAAPAAPKTVAVADKPSTFSPVKKDNRPKVEIAAPSGKMTMTATEKKPMSIAAPEVSVSIAPPKKSFYNADGTPNIGQNDPKPVTKPSPRRGAA
jgi:hypothetical protein